MEDIVKTAGILIFKNDKILLVYHTKKAKHQTGVYGIPAGRLEPGEKEIQTAIRETYDETYLEIDQNNLIPLPEIYSAEIARKNEPPRVFSLKVFLCTKFDGEPKPTEENISKWIKIDELDSYNLLPNTKQIVFDGLKYFNPLSPPKK